MTEDCKNKPLSEREVQGNRMRVKIRSKVEHVFSFGLYRYKLNMNGKTDNG